MRQHVAEESWISGFAFEDEQLESFFLISLSLMRLTSDLPRLSKQYKNGSQARY